MADAKIRIKLGDLEVEYQGDAAFLKDDLMKLVKDLQTVQPKTLAAGTGKVNVAGQTVSHGHQMTTKQIATKLGVTSGSELARAAAAHLGIIKGMATFKRIEILDEMKTATGFYKDSMSGNLSKALNTLLTTDVIVENSTEVYALNPAEEVKLKGLLGIG